MVDKDSSPQAPRVLRYTSMLLRRHLGSNPTEDISTSKKRLFSERQTIELQRELIVLSSIHATAATPTPAQKPPASAPVEQRSIGIERKDSLNVISRDKISKTL